MLQKLTNILTLCCCILMSSQLWAQPEFSDYKPQYRKWKDTYILDKIEYKKDRTIFYFRFICEEGFCGYATFYPTGHPEAWYLHSKKPNKNFELIEIRNIRREKTLMAATVKSELTLEAVKGAKKTVFTCEVHFARLPNDVTLVDLIEGRGREGDDRHFNCFDVKVKPYSSSDLGTEKDSEDKIKNFEDKNGLKHSNTHHTNHEPKKDTTKKIEVVKVDTVKKVEPKKDTADHKKTVINDNPYHNPRILNKKDVHCNELMVAEKLKFQDNSTDFMGMVDAQQTLIWMLEFLHDHPGSTLTVHGHTDIFGDKAKDEELSHQRALVIKRWFITHGIQEKRLKAEWHGHNQPIVPTGSPLNRRVEIFIDCPH